MRIYGTMTIDFAVKASTRELMIEFSEFMVKRGSINLLNYNDKRMELEIFNHEVTYLEEWGVKSFDGFGNDT